MAEVKCGIHSLLDACDYVTTLNECRYYGVCEHQRPLRRLVVVQQPADNMPSTPCAHDFESFTGGLRCRKCGMTQPAPLGGPVITCGV